MARSIYVASLEGHSGKSLVALGLVDALSRTVSSVGVFRPITRSDAGGDHMVHLLVGHDGVDLPYERCVGVTYDDVHADPEAALATIVDRYRDLDRSCEAVVVVGSDYTDIAGPTELTFNARVAANLVPRFRSSWPCSCSTSRSWTGQATSSSSSTRAGRSR